MRTQSCNTFGQRIHQAAKKQGFPLRVMFELTYRCNFKCRHCYVPYSYRRKEELRTKEIFSILEQLRDIGCFYLGFTGGEPFMRKDILEILWYAKRQGFELIIYTNGSLINEETARELQRLAPNKVDITIPAMSETAFERITGLIGSREKVFKAINFLYKNGVNLGFKSCVLKGNESEIKEIEDFSASLGALHRLNDALSPCLDGSKEPYKYRGVLKENLAVSRKPHAVSKKSEIRSKGIINGELEDCNKKTTDDRISAIDLFKCGVGKSQAAITPSGELKMCLMIDYPKYKILNKGAVSGKPYVASSRLEAKIRKPDLHAAWKKLKEMVASIRPDENYQCDKCEAYTYCKWCPGRGWLKNRSFTVCDYKKVNAIYRVNN